MCVGYIVNIYNSKCCSFVLWPNPKRTRGISIVINDYRCFNCQQRWLYNPFWAGKAIDTNCAPNGAKSFKSSKPKKVALLSRLQMEIPWTLAPLKLVCSQLRIWQKRSLQSKRYCNSRTAAIISHEKRGLGKKRFNTTKFPDCFEVHSSTLQHRRLERTDSFTVNKDWHNIVNVTKRVHWKVDQEIQAMSWIKSNYVQYPDSKLSLGHQKVSASEVEEIVDRLNVVKKTEERSLPTSGPKITKDEIDQMVERLADKDRNLEKTPERNRTGADKQMGIVNTYAWNDGTIMRNRLHTGDGNFY